MKKSFKLLFVTLLTGALIMSCTKEEEKEAEIFATEEIADEIAAALGSSNSGISDEIVEIAQLSDDYISDLKSTLTDTVFSVDTSFTRTNPSGSVVTYNYTFQMEYGYIFENGKLNRFYYNGNASGSLDAPRIGSSDSRISDWILTGLEVSSSNYLLNGTTTRTGVSQSKVRYKSNISSDSEITLTNVNINKSTLEIVEGTLEWNYTGTVNGQSYTYSVIIVYQGNGMAELTINGIKYIINISSGEIE